MSDVELLDKVGSALVLHIFRPTRLEKMAEHEEERERPTTRALIGAGAAGVGTLVAGNALRHTAHRAALKSLARGLVRESHLPNTPQEFARIRDIATAKGIHVTGQELARGVGPGALRRKDGKLIIQMPPSSGTLSKSPAVLAHELGHSTGIQHMRGGPIRAMLRHLGLGLHVGGAHTAYKAISTKNLEEKAKLWGNARNYALGGTALRHLPLLLEESRATGRALMAAKRRGQAGVHARVLLPALGTYASRAIPGLALAGAAEIARQHSLYRARKANREQEEG